jgi:hypothetical protein
MKPEESSIIGTVLLLFGVTWLLFSLTPGLLQVSCAGFQTSYCITARMVPEIWNAPGIATMVIGVILLAVRACGTSPWRSKFFLPPREKNR